jgi:hypothetical protein
MIIYLICYFANFDFTGLFCESGFYEFVFGADFGGLVRFEELGLIPLV